MMQATVIGFNDGRELLMSYATPVAGFAPVVGWIRKDRFYSVTTSKHINLYLRGVGVEARRVSDEEFNKAFEGVTVKSVAPLRKR